MKQEKVSIIIPVYNGANYMRDAIDSALAQTYPNIEVIVINDGSTDNGKTDKIAKSYGNKIRYIYKKNGGVSSAINCGIENMRGEYFSWLSHDDMYFPDKIQAEINFLEKNNLLGKKIIAYSNYLLVNKRGKSICEIIINHKIATEKPMYAFLRGAINGNSILIPKKAWDEYGPLDTKLVCTQDYAKWFEMSKTYKFIHVPKTLIKSRYHSKQTTNTNPLVAVEGNQFWLKVVKSFNQQDRKKLNSSDYAYYYYFIEYFKNTPYDEALEYCKQELKKCKKPNVKLPKEKIVVRKILSKYPQNKIIKIFQLIEHEGLSNATKHIIKKIINERSR